MLHIHPNARITPATRAEIARSFRSDWSADLYAGIRSVIGAAARRGASACQVIQQTLRGQAAACPG